MTVPNVVGLPYVRRRRTAAQRVQRVSNRRQSPTRLAGIVTRQTPSGGSEATERIDRHSHRLQGPVDVRRPRRHDAGFRPIAQTTLEAAGFRARVVYEDTDDPTFDGIVVSQDPVGEHAGGAQHARHPVRRLRFVSTDRPTDTTTTPTPREPTRARGGARRRPLERARDLARVGALRRRRRSTRRATRPS